MTGNLSGMQQSVVAQFLNRLLDLTHRKKTKAAARNKTLLNKVEYHAETSILNGRFFSANDLFSRFDNLTM